MMYKPENKTELQTLVNDENINLGNIDTSLISDMSELFKNSKRKDFNGIETWNVSNVKDMSFMFANCIYFNQPLYKWDTSNAENMSNMFNKASSFNQNINSWNVSNVKNMNSLFRNARSFNQPLNKWNTSNTESMNYMFDGAYLFNQDLNNWNVDKVKYMFFLFHNADSFEYKNIINWSFKRVKDFDKIFNIIPLEILLKICSSRNTKYCLEKLNLYFENNDKKEFYKSALKYNKNSVSEFIKKIENTHYEELKELIDSKE